MNNNLKREDLFTFVQLDEKLHDSKIEGEPIGYFKDALIRLTRSKTAILAGSIIALIVVMAVFGPMMTSYSFREQNIAHNNLPPRIPLLEKLGICDGHHIANVRVENMEKYSEALVRVLDNYEVNARGTSVSMATVELDSYALAGAKEHYYYFGTDPLGRDLWTRLWRGTRISLMIGLISAILNTSIGIIYGAISGYYGGKVDMVMQRFIEILGGLPFLVIAILFIMYFGAGILSFIAVLILVGWIGTSRMIRAQFYKYKGQEYVLAARTMGVKDQSLIFRHILPNAIGPLITATTLAIPSAIFTESFLSFLGLGIQAPEPSIGVLLAAGQKSLLNYPYMAFFPGVIISVLMLAFNAFGNEVRDSFDPSMRGM